MDGGAVGTGFEEALNAVGTVVTALNTALGDEVKSQDAKNAALYAALYFYDSGVAHLLGFPAQSKANSEARPVTDLDRLLTLLAVGKVAHPNDANVKIVNGSDHCEIWSSHGSNQTCMVHALLDTAMRATPSS